ncbi:MAG: DUF11 domain-containing protein [Prevotellaceae bacterium]|nr:DUF11 domain-containing protein [Prevotellaceae bacterium]
MDTTKQLRYYFAGDKGVVTGLNAGKDSIGWKKAKMKDGPDETLPTLPSPGAFFQASDDSLKYKYAYKYIASTCGLDTSLHVGVWIKKGYSPVLAKRIQDKSPADKYTEVDTAGNLSACTRVYQIPLPYIVDTIASNNGSRPIDTIQVDTVWRIVAANGNVIRTGFLAIGGRGVAYSYQWGNAADTVHLKEGSEYTVKYKFRYRYADPDSVSYDTVLIAVPHSIRTNRDTAGYTAVGMLQNGVRTGDTARIDVMLNDSISSCLILDSVVLQASKPDGAYADTGTSRRGGTVIAGSVTESGGAKKKIVKYISPLNYQGLDTFTYQLKDTSVYGKLAGNVKTDTVFVRVLPRYALTVTKTVDSVVNRKLRRGQGDPNLDSVLVGDTVYFSVRVKNSGKNFIADSIITVSDTLPASFDTVATSGAAVVATAPKMVLEWKIGAVGDTLNVGEEDTITYRLVALKPTNPAAPDTNRVRVSVALPKNTFEAPSGDTAFAHSDTVLLHVYESINVAFSERIDTSASGGASPLFTDTLTCDSLYQKIKFVLTAANTGYSPLKSITISDTLSAGMRLVDAAFYLIGKNSVRTPISTGSTTKTPLAADTVYTWGFSNVRVGPDSALQMELTAAVDTLGTFGSRGYAFEQNGWIDIDSTDNYDSIASVVIFQPEIKLEVKKEWGKYSTSTGSVTPSGENPYIGKGNTLQLTITVINNSTLPLRNVVVRDTLDIAYLQRREDGLHSSSPTSLLVWTTDSSSFEGSIGYLAAGDSSTLYFYVKAKDTTDYAGRGTPGVISNDKVGNVAYAYLPSYYGYDSAYCDSITEFAIQPGLDLTLKASVMPHRQRQGDTVRLKLVVANTSEEEGVDEDVAVEVVFPHDSLTYVGSAPTSGSAYDPQSSTWTISSGKLGKVDGSGSSSDSIIITLVAQDKMGRVTLGGNATSAPDANKSNNVGYDTLRIVKNPVDLRVAKKVTDTVYLAQDPVEILDSITILTDEAAIGGITLVDSLPLSVVRGSVGIIGPQELINVLKVDSTGTPGRYFVATKTSISLSSNADTTVVIRYRLSERGNHAGVATVFCDSVEATKVNNVAVATTSVLPMVNLKAAPLTARAMHPNLVGSNPAQVMEGDTIAYTLVVEHDPSTSNSDATDVTLAFDPLDDSDPIALVSVESLGSNEGAVYNNNRVVFENVRLGETATVVARVRVKPNTAGSAISWRAHLSCASDIWHVNDTAATVGSLTVVNNPKDVSVSITPRDTVFYMSDANWADSMTPMFGYTIQVTNGGTEPLTGVTVRYSGLGSSYPPGTESHPDGGWLRTFESIAAGETDTITVSDCSLPYGSGETERQSTVTVSTGVLESDPTNNSETATAKIIYDVDLKIDSIQLLSKTGAYTQGDTVAVRVKLTNTHGKKNGVGVKVWLVDTRGFTAPDGALHELTEMLALNGSLCDTLQLVIDTFTATNEALRLRIAASALIEGSNPAQAVEDSAWSTAFRVGKGADAAVWIEAVEHKKEYYSNLSYTIAVANLGRYRATNVQLHHALPDSFTVDSVRIQNKGNGVDSALTLPTDSVWSLGAVAASRHDTARITFYVTSDSGEATLPIEGYIACVNDKNVRNDTIVNALKYANQLQITPNPYHLKITKIASQKSYDQIADAIEYAIVVKNVGDSAAYGLKITDTIPRTLTYQGLLDSGKMGEASFADSVIAWEISTLTPGLSDTITFGALAREAGIVANTAQLVHVDSTAQHPFDPDIKNKKDHTCVDTTKMHSAQRITITSSFEKRSNDASWTSANAFEQGDTLRLTLVVEKVNKNEKAPGIKITPTDFADKLIFFGKGESTVTEHCVGTFNDSAMTWRLDLDTSPNAQGQLQLYAIIAPNIPTEEQGLDSFALRIDVADTSEYYPQIGSEQKASQIYLKYSALDLAVNVEVEPTEDYPANHRAVYPNEPFTYNITLQNLRGALRDTDVVTLVDTLSAGITFDATRLDVPVDTSYEIGDGRRVLRWEKNLRKLFAGAQKGETMQLQLAGCRASNVGYYPNKAQLFVNRHEADLRNNSSADTAWVVKPVDFSLKFVAEKDTIMQGDTQRLYITVTGYSESPQTDLSIAAKPIPPNLPALRFVESDKGDYTSEDFFRWDNDGSEQLLSFGDTLTRTLVVRGAVEGETAWRAVLYANGDSVADTLRLYVKKNPCNVQLTKTTSKAVFYKTDPKPDTFIYTISLRPGDIPVGKVTVRDTLPAGVDTAAEYQKGVTVTTATDNLGQNRLVVTLNIPTLWRQEDIPIKCKIIDGTAVKSYLNRAYATCDSLEASLDDNTDTALVEVRNDVNLKVSVALWDSINGHEYPGDHKFRQGDKFYVKVSVKNNGKVVADEGPTRVAVTPTDSTLSRFTPIEGIHSLGPKSPERSYLYPISSGKCGEFGISAVAATVYNSEQVKDSAGVTFSILPGADMQVKIATDPPATDYSTSRSYRISLVNIGQYRADTVELRHALDSAIVRLDYIVRWLPRGYPDTLRVQNEVVDTLLPPKSPSREIFAYADKTLTCSIDSVGKGEYIYLDLFVTTAAPKEDTTLRIRPYAEVRVHEDRDMKLGNNYAYGIPPIVVRPNPYNVSISIAPKRTDMRYSGQEKISQEYTITARNIGKAPAEGSVFYELPSGLIADVPDGGAATDDSAAVKWTIFPQLLKGEARTMSVTITPKELSSKGKSMKNIVRIEPVFRYDSAGNPVTDNNLETDLANNVDTAYLNLYSMLESWKLMEAFSPNGDGHNDVFKILDLESELVESAAIVIVNRYGNEVYYHHDYKEAQKDEGRQAFTGAGLPEGVYFYQLTVRYTDGSSPEKRGGTITLRRSRWKK